MEKIKITYHDACGKWVSPKRAKAAMKEGSRSNLWGDMDVKITFPNGFYVDGFPKSEEDIRYLESIYLKY